MNNRTNLRKIHHERSEHSPEPAEVHERLMEAIRDTAYNHSPSTDEVGARAALNAEICGLIWEANKIYTTIEGLRRELRSLLERVLKEGGLDPAHADVFAKEMWDELDRRAFRHDLNSDGDGDSKGQVTSRDTWTDIAVRSLLGTLGMADTRPARALKLERDCSGFAELFFDVFDEGLDGWRRRVTDGGEEPAGMLVVFLVRVWEILGDLLRDLIDGYPPR